MNNKKIVIKKFSEDDHFERTQRFFSLFSKPIKITFHDPGLSNSSDEDVFCLDILEKIRDCKDSKLDIFYFDSQKSPAISFLNLSEDGNSLEFKLIPDNRESYFNYRVRFLDRIKNQANQIFYSSSYKDTSIEQISKGIRDVYAHLEIDSDVFITNDIWLLENQIDSANIVSPQEAFRFVTLFCRLNDEFLYPGLSMKQYKIESTHFYWVAVNHIISDLLSLNRYIGQNYDIESDIRWTSLSIVYRCASSLETLDNIGKYYYFFDGQNAYAKLIYFFEYLMLLLVSTFELLQQVICEIYGIKEKKYNINLNPWGSKFDIFVKKLKKNDYGYKICEVLKNEKNESILKLLYIFRNNIHHPLYEKNSKTDLFSDEKIEGIELPYRERGEEILNLISNISDIGEFGVSDYKYKRSINQNPMRDIHSLLIEPFTFSHAITKHSIELLDDIISSMSYLWGDIHLVKERTYKNKYDEEIALYSDTAKKYFNLLY